MTVPHDGARGDKRKASEMIEQCCARDARQDRVSAVLDQWTTVAVGSGSAVLLELINDIRAANNDVE